MELTIKAGSKVVLETANTYAASADLTIGKVYDVLEVYHDYIAVLDDVGDRHEVGLESVKPLDVNLQITTTTFTTHKIGTASVIVSGGSVSYSGVLSVAQFKAIAAIL